MVKTEAVRVPDELADDVTAIQRTMGDLTSRSLILRKALHIGVRALVAEHLKK
jgi:hypothetical protein